LHDLRHAAASRLIANGLDPVNVASVFGHSNATVTLKVYAHLHNRQQFMRSGVRAGVTEPAVAGELMSGDPEKKRVRDRAYRERHRVELAAKQRVYYTAHREERLAYMDAYHSDPKRRLRRAIHDTLRRSRRAIEHVDRYSRRMPSG